LPFCSADRKKKTDKCVSLHWDTGFNCNHCGEKGQLHTFKRKENTKQYAKPVLSTIKADYSDKFINYVTNVRSIEIKALKALKVRESKNGCRKQKR
jgi:twinkle protein